ncbi:Bug family tripartite tricarboxylate transporter substrate binding protein [Alcaligenes sp. SDU_A2]|uniref:Bug family tripartite tricarboxylate transporter substrate binding protein n=1 Tax=Alcaligenes sp. SDU_A2 TaxID=3136634 RepID=UPI00311D6324
MRAKNTVQSRPLISNQIGKRTYGVAGVCIALTMWAMSAGQAQANEVADYPSRPVRMIVSYAAGNVTDLLARTVANELSNQWGQPVTVENKPGVGGSLGAKTASHEAPDGYTLLFSAMAAMAVNPHIYKNIGYDPLQDFVPVVNVAYPDYVLAADPRLGVKTWADLLALSKQGTNELNYGTAGNGTVPHLNMEAVKQHSGLQALHVPYRAAGAALTDLLGGRLQLQMETSAVLMPHIKSGKLVPLGTAPNRNPELPGVPALSELLPGYEAVIPWLGILAPHGTPEAIVNKIHDDVTQILAKSDIKAQLARQGLSLAGGTSQAFATTMRNDYERLRVITEQLNLKVD